MTLIQGITDIGMSRLKETYLYVFMGIFVAMMGAAVMFPFASAISGMVFWGIVIAEFIVLFIFMSARNLPTYLLFTGLTGVTLVPVLALYIGAGASGAIVNALLGTTMITGGLTWYATTTKRNYLGMGTILFWILVALIVMMIANIFIGSSIFAIVISAIAVILFSFYIIFDTQSVIHGLVEPIDAAMNIYLDVLNLFVHLLHLFGISDD